MDINYIVLTHVNEYFVRNKIKQNSPETNYLFISIMIIRAIKTTKGVQY